MWGRGTGTSSNVVVDLRVKVLVPPSRQCCYVTPCSRCPKTPEQVSGLDRNGCPKTSSAVSAVHDSVEDPIQLGARGEDQVPAVLDLVDRVAVAEAAVVLVVKIQAEARTGGVDPPIAATWASSPVIGHTDKVSASQPRFARSDTPVKQLPSLV